MTINYSKHFVFVGRLSYLILPFFISFPALHEAVAKSKHQIVKYLLKHGADPTKKNRDGNLPIDLCKDEDIADLLQANSALLDAAKKGNLEKVKKLVTPENINVRGKEYCT